MMAQGWRNRPCSSSRHRMTDRATIVLIPARLRSQRLPNKPLAEIGGLPMIVQVWQRAWRRGSDRSWWLAPRLRSPLRSRPMAAKRC